MFTTTKPCTCYSNQTCSVGQDGSVEVEPTRSRRRASKPPPTSTDCPIFVGRRIHHQWEFEGGNKWFKGMDVLMIFYIQKWKGI